MTLSPLTTPHCQAAIAVGNRTAGVTDFVDVAAAGSEAAHRFRSSGKVVRTLAGDFVGGHDMRRAARSVSGAGSSLSYRLKVQPNVPLTLEIEEIENRSVANRATPEANNPALRDAASRDAVRGYSVWVDGQRAYFRTAQTSGAGPLHFFVQVPPRSKPTVEIKLQNESDAPFHISRIWAICDFATFFARSKMAVPYYLAPTLHLSFRDFQADLQKLQTIKDSFGQHLYARPAWTTWIGYANLSDSAIGQRIAYVLRLAQSAAMPVQICFDTWWGNTPNGTDGIGGFWSDVQYQQVVYNADKKQFGLSIPNRWGNTPWLSVSHPRLNAFKTERLQFAMTQLQEQQAAAHVRGEKNLILAINLDNEPVYWATGNAGLGSEILQADFNKVTVELARRDGVILNPVDGLSFDERRWLSRSLLAYNEQIGNAAAAGAMRAPIVTNSSGAPLPEMYLRDNIYTQAMVANPFLQYPMQSAAYPFWETAAPASVRIGSEWNGNSLREREAVLHQLPLGRTAQVNAESGSRAEEMVGVKPGYALGLRYYAMYNYPLDQMNRAASEIRDTSHSIKAALYERVLKEETFVDESWKTRVVETRGLQRGLIGNTTAMALYPAANSGIGWLTYRIDAPQGDGARKALEGLSIEVSGRAFVSRDRNPNVYIRVLAGAENDVAAMREIERIFDDGDMNAVRRFDLSAVARGQKTVFVRLELSADKLPEGVLSWCAIYHLRFTQPWPAALLRTAFAQDETLETQRRQNLFVSWRRDAELALERLNRTVGKPASEAASMTDIARRAAKTQLTKARAAYGKGEYALAYQQAAEAENWLLLSTQYRVSGGGELKPYPIRVETAAPLTFTLERWSETDIAFNLAAERETTAKLHIGGLRAGVAYALLPIDSAKKPNSWKLRPASPQEAQGVKLLTANAAGAVETTVPVTSDLRPQSEQVIRGTYRAVLEKSPPVFALFRDDGKGAERVTVAESTRILRGEVGKVLPEKLEALQYGDDVTVVLGADGIATQVTAETRTVAGVIEEFGQLEPHAMPFVRLSGSDKRNIIDLNAPLQLFDASGAPVTTTFRTAPPGSVAIKAGDAVTLRLHPRTGRVFEVRKIATPVG